MRKAQRAYKELMADELAPRGAASCFWTPSTRAEDDALDERRGHRGGTSRWPRRPPRTTRQASRRPRLASRTKPSMRVEGAASTRAEDVPRALRRAPRRAGPDRDARRGGGVPSARRPVARRGRTLVLRLDARPVTQVLRRGLQPADALLRSPGHRRGRHRRGRGRRRLVAHRLADPERGRDARGRVLEPSIATSLMR